MESKSQVFFSCFELKIYVISRCWFLDVFGILFLPRRGVDHECDDSWFMNGDREGLTSGRWPDGEEVDGVDGNFLCNRNKRK